YRMGIRRWAVEGSGCAAAAADRAAERPADDVDHLVDILVGLAPFRGGPDAALDVVLEDHDRQGVDGGPERRRLLEDVDAVLLALDHPGDAADLALHPREPADESRLVLRIGVAEVVRRRVGRRATVGLSHRALLRRAARRRVPQPPVVPASRRMIPPGGIARVRWRVRRGRRSGSRLRPMDPRDRTPPFENGVDCAVCGRNVPAERIRILASRDDLTFVELTCAACRSESLGMILAGATDGPDGRAPYGEFLPADDAR